MQQVSLPLSGLYIWDNYTFLFVLVFFVCSQEISVSCPGQQWLSGGEEEESRGHGEGCKRRRCGCRAQPASERGAGRCRGFVVFWLFCFISHQIHFLWRDWMKNIKLDSCFSLCDFAAVAAAGVLKADVTQGPLVSLSNSTSEQASTSKQQYSVEQQLYGASGSREDIFSLAGPSYMTASKNCGSRTLGCVSETYVPENVAV